MKIKTAVLLIITLTFFSIFNFIASAADIGDLVIVGGMPFGIKFYTEGILVSGISEVDTDEGNISPGKLAGLENGDIITAIDGITINNASEMMELVSSSKGAELSFDVLRNTKKLKLKVQPRLSLSENQYKTGLWIKDGTAGIGTVTYIDKQNSSFAGLGHGVCDTETAELLKMKKADVCDVIISRIKKGVPDDPGALQGILSASDKGYLTGNTAHGVYGVIDFDDSSDNIKAVIAPKEELVEGPADILCTLDDNSIGKYSIEIEKIFKHSENTKNFIIRVTDPKLIKSTGGIVQGMSGSPIIQDGKLVGAVTHVLVEDPTRGYGIFIENMLE